MIVSFCAPKSELVYMTGSTFAGMYRITAEMRNAHVRVTLSGLRKWSVAPQRGHHAACACGGGFATRAQVWQTIRPWAQALAPVVAFALAPVVFISTRRVAATGRADRTRRRGPRISPPARR